MKARLKYLYHATRWNVWRGWSFLAAIPAWLGAWIWEYCRHTRMILKGFRTILDTPEVVVLLCKGFFASAVTAWQVVRNRWRMYYEYIEQECERYAKTEGKWIGANWYIRSRLFIKQYQWQKRWGSLVVLKDHILTKLRDSVDPPIEGVATYVG